MASSPVEQLWQTFFDQHQSIVSLLDTHASLLAQMNQACLGGGDAQEIVRSRLLNTENLIATFKESTESLREVTKREEVDVNAVKRPVPTVPHFQADISSEPKLDPSGLFTVDSNPTPVEDLIRETSSSKRKNSDSDAQASNGRPPSGKGRKRIAPRQEQEQGSDVDDSFVRGVQARIKAKEDRRKARLNKKRKRQSDNSTSASGSKGPKNKKQKQKHEAKSSSFIPLDAKPGGGKRSNAEPSMNGTQNGPPNKKRKKTKP